MCVCVCYAYIVKGRGIGRGVILEEVAGDGCVFDDIRGCTDIRSCSMRIDHDDEEQRYCLRYDKEEEMQGMMMMMMMIMIIRSHSD